MDKARWLRDVIGDDLTDQLLGRATEMTKELEGQSVRYKARPGSAKAIASIARETMKQLDPLAAERLDEVRLQKAKEAVSRAAAQLDALEIELQQERAQRFGPVTAYVGDMLQMLGVRQPGAMTPAQAEKAVEGAAADPYLRSAAMYIRDLLEGKVIR